MIDRPLLSSAALLSRATRPALSALLALGALPACTEFADEDDIASMTEQPNSPGGLGSFGGQGQESPEWACIGGEPEAPPAELGTSTVTFSIFIADTVSRQPPPGLTVAACSPLDVECASPMVDGIRPDENGMIHAQVPQNFAGFFRVVSDQSVPAVLYVDRPVTANITAEPMLVIGDAAFKALTSGQGVTIDEQMGHLLLRAFDCNGVSSPQMRFTNNRGGQPFAFVDGLPVVGETITDAQGTAGFINVLPGLAVVQSQRVSDARVTSTASGQVRAGWFTYLLLTAGPS